MNSFLHQVQSNLEKEALLPSQDEMTIIAAVSGGPDSLALADSLWQLNQKNAFSSPLEIIVAHLVHPFVPDETEDENFLQHCREFAAKRDLEVVTKRVETWKVHKNRGGSLEEVGRDLRYEFFAQVAFRYQASAVALGHHLDDQAETVLGRILRGTGFQGLRGIPWKRPLTSPLFGPTEKVWVIRPLLNITRKEIVEFLKSRQIPYLADYANLNPRFFRNRLRREVLPYLEEFQPQMRKKLLQLRRQARWTYDYLSSQARRHKKDLSRDPYGAVILPAQKLRDLHQAVLSELIREILSDFDTREISFENVHRIVKNKEAIASNPYQKKWSWDFPGQVRVEGEPKGLAFFAPRKKEENQIFLKIPGTTALSENLKLQISQESAQSFWAEVSSLSPQWEGLVFADLDSLKLPLVARKRRDGDLFYPLGAPGEKKVKDILIDKKIPSRIRDHLWLIEDSQKTIVAIERVGSSHKTRIREESREMIRIDWNRKNCNLFNSLQ